MRDFLEGIVLMRPKSFQRFVKQCFAKSANTKLGLLSAGPTRVGMQAWASEGFLPVEGFLPFFPGGPKVLKFSFYPSKLKKQSFLLIISKSRGSKAPPVPPSDAHGCKVREDDSTRAKCFCNQHSIASVSQSRVYQLKYFISKS